MRRVFELELTEEQRVKSFRWIEENKIGEHFATIGQIFPEELVAKFGFYDGDEFKRVQKVIDRLRRNRRRKEARAERLKKVMLFFRIIKPESEGEQ